MGCSNCPMMEASVRKSVLALSLEPGFSVLMATLKLGNENIDILRITTNLQHVLSLLLGQLSSADISEFSTTNYGLYCDVSRVLEQMALMYSLLSDQVNLPVP